MQVKFVQDDTFEILSGSEDLPEAPSELHDVLSADYVTEDPIDALFSSTSQSAMIVDPSPTHVMNSTFGSDPSKVPRADFLHMHVRSISNSHKSPSRPGSRRLDDLFPSTDLLSPISVPSFKPSWPFDSQHEARLFAHYIKEISPWVNMQHKIFFWC